MHDECLIYSQWSLGIIMIDKKGTLAPVLRASEDKLNAMIWGLKLPESAPTHPLGFSSHSLTQVSHCCWFLGQSLGIFL